MRKKKVKLFGDQKLIYERLEAFVKDKIMWVGEQDLREIAQEECWYVVFTMREDQDKLKKKYGTTECYDVAIAADSKETINAILDFTPANHMLAINLKWGSLVKEVRTSFAPMEEFSYGKVEENA